MTSDFSNGLQIKLAGLPFVQWLRTRLFEISVLVWSLPFGLAILTYFQMRHRPAEIRWALRLWSSGFIFFARWIVGVRYRIEGRAQVPVGPVIYVCNHQSYWESIAFTVLVPHLNIISKAEAMDIPVFGWGLRHAPMIRVFRDRRGTNIRRILRDSLASIIEGRSLLLFPEGTRVKPGRTRHYARSLELLYRECGVPIVPVAHNAGFCWTEGFKTKHPGLITLRFYPPIAPGNPPKQVAGDIEEMLNREKEVLARKVRMP